MNNEAIVNEETALLRSSIKKQKPLPWFQLSIALLLQICEPMAALSINPYINQLISELNITGGDERKVGYYAGLIESLFFATEAITVLHWSRLSDRVGRKPVLLIGLMGLSISMLCFGLSRTFGTLVLSRCLCGLLNGNIGVMKSVMGELTDSSNRAEGFSFMPVVWAAGATLGPLMGGTLSNPYKRFPILFEGKFWRDYPYFLPCIAVSTFIFIAFFIAAIFFEETVPNKRPCRSTYTSEGNSTPDIPLFPDNTPLPLRQLLVYPVVISVSNYVAIAFLSICINALLPLFFAMPIEIGGLGFSPSKIGYILGLYGVFTGVYQVFYFAKTIKYLGERRMFIWGVLTCLPIFSLFPIISFYSQRFGISFVVYMLIGIMLTMMAFMDMAFGCIYMFITTSSPNKHSLGATNGLSQMTVSIARAIGPAMSTSLFSLSVEQNILGGYAVYVFLFILSSLAVLLAVRLPHEMWKESGDSAI